MNAEAEKRPLSRRRFLAATTAMAALAAASRGDLWAQQVRELGAPLRAYGERSPFEKAVRIGFGGAPFSPTGASLSPLQDLYGIITPSALHFERHHSGVPAIDPEQHRLLIHGLVERPLVFTMAELKRLPSVSRVHFLECSGNTGAEYKSTSGPDPQRTSGLLSCSEWTGVPAADLLRQAGVKPGARWVLAEGADPGRHARSIPLEKIMDDALLAYAQNGEAVRPEQGYPLRLLLPGFEGNTNVKWLRRLHVVDQPSMTRDETADYTDLLPSGKAYQFSFVMEAKSIVTRPAGGQRLPGPGPYEITGVAWSGRARISQVEVSTDGGQNWQKAQLQQPVYANAVVRFRLPWNWDGREAVIGSRCRDESGFLQPTHEEIVAARGEQARFHYNGIKWWRLQASGELTHA